MQTIALVYYIKTNILNFLDQIGEIMQINFCKDVSKTPKSLIIFVDDKFAANQDVIDINTKHDIDIITILKNCKLEGKFGETLTIPTAQTDVRSIVIICVGKVDELDKNKIIKLGSKIFAAASCRKLDHVCIYSKSLPENITKNVATVLFLAFGLQLRSYKFDKYFTDVKNKRHALAVDVICNDADKMAVSYKAFEAVIDGVELTKTLISEPPNKIFPESFAEICMGLVKHGVEVEVLDEKMMKSLGMNALLGVAQGSGHSPKMVIMKYNGGKSGDAPLAFCGKGVTFDSGGLSIKPADSMEDMKYDMGGAGVVTGLIKSLALRKARVNVIGVVGLVENMPDGNAQRPGDIVTSMSGQTIEILNTDAEGRLVLADVLWYTQSKFSPKLIIDLATLTGAISVALGNKYCGLFSNNDELAKKLIAAGIEDDEKLWRLPMGPEYDKMIDSPTADMQNISNERTGGGSITAAQFLQRFVNNTPWAHLDIAAVTWSKKPTDYHEKGATGFGVRLLGQFIYDNYEQK